MLKTCEGGGRGAVVGIDDFKLNLIGADIEDSKAHICSIGREDIKKSPQSIN